MLRRTTGRPRPAGVLLRLAGLIAALVAAASAAASPVQAEPVPQADFTAQVAQALAHARPELGVDVSGVLRLTARIAPGRAMRIDLDALYRLYQRDPDDLDTMLRSYVTAVVRRPEEAIGGLDPEGIVALLRGRGWVSDFTAALRAQPGGRRPVPLVEPFVDDLVIVYAEDRDHRIRYLTTADAIAMPRDQLRSLALRNLERLLFEVNFVPRDGMSFLTTCGDYEASLLLFDHIWTRVHAELTGDVVVIVPARNLVAVAGSRDANGVQELQDYARQIVRSRGAALTEALFVYRDGRFIRYEPP